MRAISFVIFALLAFSQPTYAGMEVDEDYGWDGCGFWLAQLPWLSAEYKNFSVIRVNNEITDFRWQCDLTETSSGIHFMENSGLRRTISSNNPSGPPQGDTSTTLSETRSTPGNIEFKDGELLGYYCFSIAVPCLFSAAAPPLAVLCAASFPPCFVHSIPKNSPNGVAFLGAPAEIGERFTIPFVVTEQGDGDWVVFSVNGVEFFRRLLTDFEIENLYHVAVPDELLDTEVPMLWSFWLEDGGAEVPAHFYVGTETLPALPSGCL